MYIHAVYTPELAVDSVDGTILGDGFFPFTDDYEKWT